jgi:thiol-disulfide isomerase/thioredoxin
MTKILSGLTNGGFFNKLKSFIPPFNMKTIGIILLILILLIVGLYMYNNQKSQQTRENFEDGSDDKKTAELMFFSVDWCPHCKTAKPEWEQLKAEYKDKKINGYKVIFTDIDCTKETPQVEKLMNTYKIEGYPTIKLLKDGQVIDYDAKPTKDTLVKFLNTVL